MNDYEITRTHTPISYYNLDKVFKNKNTKTQLKQKLIEGVNLKTACSLLKINYVELKSWCAFVRYLEGTGGEIENIERQNPILIFLYQKYVKAPKKYKKYIDLVYDIRSWQAESTLRKIRKIGESQDWKAHQWLISYLDKDLNFEDENKEQDNQNKIQVSIVSADTPTQVNRLEVLEAEVKNEK